MVLKKVTARSHSTRNRRFHQEQPSITNVLQRIRSRESHLSKDISFKTAHGDSCIARLPAIGMIQVSMVWYAFRLPPRKPFRISSRLRLLPRPLCKWIMLIQGQRPREEPLLRHEFRRILSFVFRVILLRLNRICGNVWPPVNPPCPLLLLLDPPATG